MDYKKITLILCLSIFLSAERSANAQSITFNYTGTVQTWTVPTCVSAITITGTGASGGDVNGGLGAKIQGTFTVTPGQVLDVMVGQKGFNNSANYGGAGGGGSFVWDNASTTLMVAAGGGGGGVSGCTGVTGGAGSSTITPTAGAGAGGGAGGSGGNGGNYGTSASSYGTGGGGCGWLSNGQTNPGSFNEGAGGGGFSPLNGGAGGAAGVGIYVSGAGGYGGGGGEAGQCGAGGGGGGYNGGGGGNGFSGSLWGSGGGGGSYNAGSNPTNTAGVNSGNGSVTILYAAVVVNPVDSVNITCHGGANGIATCHPTGGGTPYTYLWQPVNQSTQTISNLTAGIYTITVTLPCGGTNTATVTITQPNAVGVTTIVNANVLCNGGNNGKITATANNGTSPYTYSWSNVNTNSVDNNLTAGSYTITVTDNCAQTATAVATITQPAVLTDSAYDYKDVLCYGSNDGAAGSIARGGTKPYTYLWSAGGKTTDSIAGLTAGIYSVTVTDAHGCSTSSTATVTQPTVLKDTAFVTANVLCYQQNNGGIGSSVTGGIMPYTYLWTPGGATTATVNGLTAGTYSLSVHDSNGCSASAVTTVTQPNLLTAVATAYANVICNGGSDGGASVLANGGTLPYTYSWSPGGSTTDSAIGLSVGTYTVNVWDLNDCNISTTVTITQPIALIVGAGTVMNNLCNGDNIGIAVAYVSGGPAPYTYSWTGGSQGDSATGLSVGTYTVNVTDINGCTGSAMTSVTQPSALSILLNSVPDDGSCTGAAWLQVTGGVGPYTYLWQSGGATSYKITNQCTGNYCCRVTDANGCYDNVCVNIGSYLGVSNVSGNGGIKIYPNPTNGQVTIENGGSGENTVIEIYNVLGESVYSGSLNAQGTTTVNIGSQPNGVYLYRVKSQANGTILSEGKLVLQK